MQTEPSHSRDDIAALAERATLGAGLPAAIACEAATATDWLRARGVEACDPLLSLLFLHDEKGPLSADPRHPAGPEGAAWLCPLRTGIVVRRQGLAALPPRLTRMALPILLLPAMAEAARSTSTPVAIAWPGGTACTDGDDIACADAPGMADVTLLTAPAATSAPRPAFPGPDQMILAALSIYADRARTGRAASA